MPKRKKDVGKAEAKPAKVNLAPRTKREGINKSVPGVTEYVETRNQFKRAYIEVDVAKASPVDTRAALRRILPNRDYSSRAALLGAAETMRENLARNGLPTEPLPPDGMAYFYNAKTHSIVSQDKTNPPDGPYWKQFSSLEDFMKRELGYGSFDSEILAINVLHHAENALFLFDKLNAALANDSQRQDLDNLLQYVIRFANSDARIEIFERQRIALSAQNQGRQTSEWVSRLADLLVEKYSKIGPDLLWEKIGERLKCSADQIGDVEFSDGSIIKVYRDLAENNKEVLVLDVDTDEIDEDRHKRFDFQTIYERRTWRKYAEAARKRAGLPKLRARS